jgi:DNA-directed RNA polymerase subunit beta
LFEDKIDKLKGGDELPPGVIKMVKVFVAIKRNCKGDKMPAGTATRASFPVLSRKKTCPIEDGRLLT